MESVQQSSVENNILERIRNLEAQVNALSRKNVEADQLLDVAPEIGARYDTLGHIMSLRLNRISFFSDIWHEIPLPTDAFTGDNMLVITFEGHFFQNTGSSQTLTPKLFLGAGGVHRIDSQTSLTIGSSTTRRAWTYVAKVSQAPNGGNWVICNERFTVESATAGSAQVIARSTVTQCSSFGDLSEIDTAILQLINGAPATRFRIFSDWLTVQVIDGVGEDEVHWYSQPTGSSGFDNRIRSDAPNTNESGLALIAVGEHNAAAQVSRTLIKFSDLANLTPIIDDIELLAAYLYVTIATELSSNARDFKLWRLLRDWDLTTATWNQWSAGNNWGTAGAGNATTDYDGSAAVATRNFSASETVGTVKSFILDLDILRGMIDGTYPNYGWLMKAETENNDAYQFHSSQASLPDLAPILHIIYRRLR